MKIEDEFQVQAPVDQVWEYMQDIPKVAPCMPGAQLEDMTDPDTFQGQIRTSLGPVTLTFNGSGEILERNQAAKRIVIKASGSEAKGKGQASMNVTATLQGAGNATRVQVSQDLQLSGAAAQYGRGMISDVASMMMRQFGDCVTANIQGGRGGAGAPVQQAGEIKGISVGISYALMTITRFFRRLLGLNFREQKKPASGPSGHRVGSGR